MFVLLLTYLILITIFMFPFPFDLMGYFSLRTKQAGSNFKLAFYTVDIGIKLSAQGIEIDGIKSEDGKSFQSNKKKFDMIYDPRILQKINIDSINLTFQYGNAQDAYNTCMVCNAADTISNTANMIFQDRIKIFRKVIIPIFNKDAFYLQLRIDIKVNLFIIFSALFKIILLKIKKKFKIGGTNI